MRSTVVINGVTITTDGRSVRIHNGHVIVDGKDVTPDAKEIDISVDGNIESIEVDVCQKIFVTGDAGSIVIQSGDVEVGGDVRGSIQTMSGDINCYGSIKGNASTMAGDIIRRE